MSYGGRMACVLSSWRSFVGRGYGVHIRRVAVVIFLPCSACLGLTYLPGPQPARLPADAANRAEPRRSSPPGLSGSLYTTLAEVRKQPALFDGQKVRLRGKVVEVRGGTFKLADDAGNAVKVVMA